MLSSRMFLVMIPESQTECRLRSDDPRVRDSIPRKSTVYDSPSSTTFKVEYRCRKKAIVSEGEREMESAEGLTIVTSPHSTGQVQRLMHIPDKMDQESQCDILLRETTEEKRISLFS